MIATRFGFAVSRLLAVAAGLAALAGTPARAQPITFAGDIGNPGTACTFVPLGVFTHTLTLIGIAGVGQTVIVSVATSADIGLGVVTDSSGNVWSQDTVLAVPIFTSSVTSRITNPLGGAIFLPYNNLTGSGQTSCAVVSVFSNVKTSPPWFDQTGNSVGLSTSASATTAGATSQPNELVMGLFAGITTGFGVTFTPGPGFTALTSACFPTQFCVYPEFKVVSGTGLQTADATFTSSTPFPVEVLVSTYKGTAFPVELQRLWIE